MATPDASSIHLSPGQAIYVEVGRALSTFSYLEYQLCRVFVIAIRNAYSDQAEMAYWTITSFDARLRMVSATVNSRYAGQNALLKEWDELRTKLGPQNTVRNKIAHGTVVTMDYSTYRNPELRPDTFFAPYFWGRSTKPTLPQQDEKTGVVWHDPRPKERLSAKQINQHREGFMAHAQMLNEFAEKMRAVVQQKVKKKR